MRYHSLLSSFRSFFILFSKKSSSLIISIVSTSNWIIHMTSLLLSHEEKLSCVTQVRVKEGNKGREDEVIVNFSKELINVDTIIYILILYSRLYIFTSRYYRILSTYQYIQEKHMDEPHESQRDHGELCVLNFCSNKNLCPQNNIYVCLSY